MQRWIMKMDMKLDDNIHQNNNDAKYNGNFYILLGEKGDRNRNI